MRKETKTSYRVYGLVMIAMGIGLLFLWRSVVSYAFAIPGFIVALAYLIFPGYFVRVAERNRLRRTGVSKQPAPLDPKP
jgi:hypothetical protein